MSEDEPLTTAQAAAALGWSIRTLDRRVKDGTLPIWMRLPGATGARLFARSEIERIKRETQQHAN